MSRERHASCCRVAVRWVKELFKTADRNGDNCLNLKEIVGLMKLLNIEVDLEAAKEIFQVGTPC